MALHTADKKNYYADLGLHRFQQNTGLLRFVMTVPFIVVPGAFRPLWMRRGDVEVQVISSRLEGDLEELCPWASAGHRFCPASQRLHLAQLPDLLPLPFLPVCQMVTYSSPHPLEDWGHPSVTLLLGLVCLQQSRGERCCGEEPSGSSGHPPLLPACLAAFRVHV